MFDIHLEYWPVIGAAAMWHSRVIPCDAYQVHEGQLTLSGLRGWTNPEMNFPLTLVKVWWVTESEWAEDAHGK